MENGFSQSAVVTVKVATDTLLAGIASLHNSGGECLAGIRSGNCRMGRVVMRVVLGMIVSYVFHLIEKFPCAFLCHC